MKAHEIFWNEDTWSINPPENWEEICAVANALIVEHLNENNIDLAYITSAQEQELTEFLGKLWADYCEADVLGGIESVWGED